MSKEAFKEIIAPREGIQAVLPGLSLSKFLHDVSNDVGQLANHGRTELAAALFNESAYVLYMKGQATTEQMHTPDNGIEAMKQPEVERGGREM